MKLSEVAELLTFMAAFDRRTIGEADVLAWGSLETIQRTDLATAKAAVILFFEQVPPDRREAPYLDPRELKRQIQAVRRRAEIEEARERAKRPQLEAPAGTYDRPRNFNDLVQEAYRRNFPEVPPQQELRDAAAGIQAGLSNFGRMP